jgi:uncharacterized protein with PIN domain
VEIKFIIDNNVGKLAKWLRIMGYDALLFKEEDDGKMVKVALAQDRVILTKDTQIMRRRLVTSGRLKAILIEDDEPKAQCNQRLVGRSKDEVRDLVPSHVFETQSLYMECPSCHRIYWRGTHWQAMSRELEILTAQK